MASVEEAKKLLDKALADEHRVDRQQDFSGNQPLYLSTTRWEFVRQARRLLEDEPCRDTPSP
jgi:hypothetical protein